MISRPLSWVLGTALVLQLGFLVARDAVPNRYVNIKVGEALPFALRDINGQGVAHTGSCNVAFMCRVSCVWCGRLAERDVAGEFDGRATWLILGNGDEGQRFAQATGLPRGKIYTMPASRLKSGGLRRLVLNVPVTPMRVIWDNEGIVRDVAPLASIPTSEELAAICAGL